jgi:diguanylate cyclase (GGDEF)-like protein
MVFRFGFSIKFALVLLVTICIVPAALIAVVLLSYDYARAREARTESAVVTARTIAYSVDKEFYSIEATLRALATSPSLSTQDLRAFYRQAKEVQDSTLVHNFTLSTPSGKQLIDTGSSLSHPLLTVSNSTQLRLLADTDGPVISGLTRHPVNNQPIVSVSIPVRRAGKHIYNLSAEIVPGAFAQLLKSQQLAPDWIVAVLDSGATIVARTHEMSRFSGKQASRALLDAMSFDNEGGFEGQTSEGIEVLGVFSRSGISNWSVAIGIPSTTVTAELRTKLGWLGVTLIILLAGSIGLAMFIGTKIATSVRGLRKPALALGQGQKVVIRPLQLKEANEVATALKQASVMLQSARHQATHDVLTGLPNRVLFNDLVNKQIALSERAGTQFSVLFIDLDGFKPVNDIHGHAAGDRLLCEVAARLRSELRASDMAARLGGDEFAVVLVGTPGNRARRLAENLIRVVSKPYDFNGYLIRISASIGAAGYPEAGNQDHELLRRADLAMYQAKEAGKGQVVCATTGA